jgi:uncharacterized protein YutE (UPF0331/DUF86 family)
MSTDERLIAFLIDSLEYFEIKLEGVDRDRYFADRDIRNILDKTINDIILCSVDICEELLKSEKKTIPDTYRDTILACHDLLGDCVIAIAPLVRHRNEMIHQYVKVNWQNIVTVKQKINAIRDFVSKVEARKYISE